MGKEAGARPLMDGNPTTRQSSALVPITLSEAFSVCHLLKPKLVSSRSPQQDGKCVHNVECNAEVIPVANRIPLFKSFLVWLCFNSRIESY